MVDPHGKSHGNKSNSLSSGNINAITNFNNGTYVFTIIEHGLIVVSCLYIGKF